MICKSFALIMAGRGCSDTLIGSINILPYTKTVSSGYSGGMITVPETLNAVRVSSGISVVR